MTFYLIDYDRSSGTIVFVNSFDSAQRVEAESARLAKEREHRGSATHEVVLLEAPSAKALEATHGRYFNDLAKIAMVAST